MRKSSKPTDPVAVPFLRTLRRLEMLPLAGFVVLFLCPSAFGQAWTHLGSLPPNPTAIDASAGAKTPATNVQPFRRHWHKLVYLGGTSKKMMYWPANPNCCAGTFSNAIFLFDTGKAVSAGNATAPGVWTLAWSRGTKASLGKAPISSISREKGIVTVNFSSDPLSVFHGGNALITSTNSPSNHSFDGLYSITSSEDLLAHSLTYVQSPTLPDEAGSCAGTGPAAKCGFVVTPTDDLHHPSDRHPYWIIAYDEKRNVMYNGFGTSHASLTGCGDCSEKDLYKLDFNLDPPEWTQLCGDARISVPCADNKGVAVPGIQEGQAAYDKDNDVFVIYGGLVKGSQVDTTWEYKPATNTWTRTCEKDCLAQVGGPKGLNKAGLVYDETGKTMVLFGGVVAGGGGKADNNETFLYDTSTHKWSKAKSSVNPPPQSCPPVDYDPDRGSVILISGDKTGSPSHVWEWKSATKSWADLNIADGPPLSTVGDAWNDGGYDRNAHKFVLIVDQTSQQTAHVEVLTLPALSAH
jgi:hypothetical protein